MPNLAKIKAALKDLHDIDINIGRNVGNKVNALTDAEIEAAIKARFPGANIASHKVIPAQPESKFGPFEPTSQISLKSPSVTLNEAIGGLSQDLGQQAIPAVNKTTKEAILAGPQANEWGGQFSKQHFVRPGEETAYGNLQQQFKSQFTPNLYHSSPSPNIKSFDSSKSIRGEEWTTPGVTFASPSPKFTEDYLQNMVTPGNPKQAYPTGATMYPVSVNKGNHFDVDTPLGEIAVSKFIKESGMPAKRADQFAYEISDPHSNWNSMESSGFLDFLRKEGYDSFSVNEAGVKNVGVFDPSRVRGKFAEFDPAEAANPEFMKAQGGLINIK